MTAPASHSLHERILADIRERILSDAWPPGHRIPFETELCVQFSCSRMTVNKALSLLARSGLIERRRKAGSFVAQPRSQSAVLEIQDVKIEVEALGLAYRYQLLDRTQRKATEIDRTLLGLTAATQILAMSCLHFAGDKPFCLEQRLINLSAVPLAKTESFVAAAPGPWLLARVPWTEARHTIRASNADPELAKLLAIKASTACLIVERRTWAVERPVTHVSLTYPGARREIVASFRPA